MPVGFLTATSPGAWIPLGTDPAPALTVTLRVPDDITAIEIQGHNATGKFPASVQVSYYNATSPGVPIPGPTLTLAPLSYENGDHAAQRFSVFLPQATGVVLAVGATAALRVELYAHCLFFEPFDTYEKFTGLTAGGTAARLAAVPLRMFVAGTDSEIFDGETISCASCFAMVNTAWINETQNAPAALDLSFNIRGNTGVALRLQLGAELDVKTINRVEISFVLRGFSGFADPDYIEMLVVEDGVAELRARGSSVIGFEDPLSRFSSTIDVSSTDELDIWFEFLVDSVSGIAVNRVQIDLVRVRVLEYGGCDPDAPGAVVDAQTGCRVCDGTHWYQDEIGQSECKPLTVCVPGEYVTTAPTSSSDRGCASCTTVGNGEFFSATANRIFCHPWRAACGDLDGDPLTMVEVAAPTVTSDRMCEICNGTHWYQDEVGQTECKPVTFCAAGDYEEISSTTTSDTICAACPAGTFSNTVSCTLCEAGTYQDEAGKSFCDATTLCQPGRFVASPATTTSDTICASCPAGTFSSTTNALECHACPAGTYQDDHESTSCKTTALCEAGKFIEQPATPSSDTVCADCPAGKFSEAENTVECAACPAGFFQPAPGQAECVSVSRCVPGEYQTTAHTPTTDRVCGTCSAGTFSSEDNALVCTAWQVCPAGQFEQSPGTVSTDRVCADCPVGSFSPTSGQLACTACKVCVSGQYISRPCSATRDTGCANCILACTLDEYLSPECDSASTVAPACHACHASCATCSDGVSCDTCDPSTPVLIEGGLCSGECPDGYFLDREHQCVPCQEPCATCENGATVCKSCTSGLHVNAGCVEACPGTHFEVVGENKCQAIGTCDPGQYVVVTHSPTSDRVCAACDPGKFSDLPNQPICTDCPADTYQLSGESTACNVTTVCRDGESEIVAATPTSDRECAECAPGTTDHDSSPETACVDCPAGLYQDEAGTVFCKVCSACASGTYETAPCTPTTDRQCVACRRCPEKVARPCSGTRDTECTSAGMPAGEIAGIAVGAIGAAVAVAAGAMFFGRRWTARRARTRVSFENPNTPRRPPTRPQVPPNTRSRTGISYL